MSNERIAFLRKEMLEFCEPRTQEIDTFILAMWNDNELVSTIAAETEYSEKTIRIKLTKYGIDWRSRPEPDPKPTELKLIY